MPSVNADHAWVAVLNRDRFSDGRVVYAVSSTRVYCRPSCPSRRPTRNHVMFFDSPQLAESAGFRACLRCRPQSFAGSEAEERVERARCYLDDHADEPITLRRCGSKGSGLAIQHCAVRNADSCFAARGVPPLSAG